MHIPPQRRRWRGHPTTQAFNMRISDEERSWIQTEAAVNHTSLAYVVRSLIYGAMEADEDRDQQRIDQAEQFADFDPDEVPQRQS